MQGGSKKRFFGKVLLHGVIWVPLGVKGLVIFFVNFGIFQGPRTAPKILAPAALYEKFQIVVETCKWAQIVSICKGIKLYKRTYALKCLLHGYIGQNVFNNSIFRHKNSTTFHQISEQLAIYEDATCSGVVLQQIWMCLVCLINCWVLISSCNLF